MTFAQIAKQIFTLQHKAAYGSPATRAWDLVCSAETNANDTLWADKACTEEQWDDVARSSLELLLGDERDAKVRALFTRRGFTF